MDGNTLSELEKLRALADPLLYTKFQDAKQKLQSTEKQLDATVSQLAKSNVANQNLTAELAKAEKSLHATTSRLQQETFVSSRMEALMSIDKELAELEQSTMQHQVSWLQEVAALASDIDRLRVTVAKDSSTVRRSTDRTNNIVHVALQHNWRTPASRSKIATEGAKAKLAEKMLGLLADVNVKHSVALGIVEGELQSATKKAEEAQKESLDLRTQLQDAQALIAKTTEECQHRNKEVEDLKAALQRVQASHATAAASASGNTPKSKHTSQHAEVSAEATAAVEPESVSAGASPGVVLPNRARALKRLRRVVSTAADETAPDTPKDDVVTNVAAIKARATSSSPPAAKRPRAATTKPASPSDEPVGSDSKEDKPAKKQRRKPKAEAASIEVDVNAPHTTTTTAADETVAAAKPPRKRKPAAPKTKTTAATESVESTVPSGFVPVHLPTAVIPAAWFPITHAVNPAESRAYSDGAAAITSTTTVIQDNAVVAPAAAENVLLPRQEGILAGKFKIPKLKQL